MKTLRPSSTSPQRPSVHSTPVACPTLPGLAQMPAPRPIFLGAGVMLGSGARMAASFAVFLL